MLDCLDISVKAGISVQAVRRKLSKVTPISIVSRGGRPANLYNDDVLKLFPQIVSENKKIVMQINEILNPDKVKTKRPDKDKARLIPEELEDKVKKASFKNYLENARADSVKKSVEDACTEYWDEIKDALKKEKSLDKFKWYFYTKRIMNRSQYFTGYYHSEKWQYAWERVHKQNKYNNSLPTNRYDIHKLMTDAGLIGEGFGAGLVWIIDGTQFDAWTEIDSKTGKPTKVLKNYLAIMDGITGMPLYLGLLDKGETIEDTARVLWEAVQIHGVPPLGVILDNGRAFKSAQVQALINSWYTDSEKEEIKSNEFRIKLLNSTKENVYPLAKIPRFPLKAKLERSFHELNKHQSERVALSYVGSRDSMKTSYELGSNPTKAIAAAPPVELMWQDFLVWVYTDYIFRSNPGHLHNFQKMTGLAPSIINFWKYYGGNISTTDGLDLQVSKSNPIPEIAEYFAKYAMSNNKHTVKAGLGSLSLVDDGNTYNLISENLTMELAGVKVNVVLDGNQGYIFKEYDEKEYCSLTPKKGDLYFVGVGLNQTFSKVSDLDRKKITSKIRRKIDNDVAAFTREKLDGKEFKPANKVLTEPYLTVFNTGSVSPQLIDDTPKTLSNEDAADFYFDLCNNDNDNKPGDMPDSIADILEDF